MALFNDVIDWVRRGAQGLSDTFLGTTYGQERLQENQFNMNRLLAGEQRDWEEDMWNQSNVYNSPDAQMQRLRDAGLNPSLVYGQPISEAGVPAGAEASVGLGSAQHGAFTPQGIYQLDLLQAQSELLQAQKDEIRSRIPLNESKIDLNTASIADIISRIDQRKHQNALTDAERDNISFEQMYKNYQIDLSYRRLENETALTNAQVSNLEANTRKALAEAQVSEREFYEMCYTFAVRCARLDADVKLTQAQTDVAYSTAKKLGLEADAILQGIKMYKPEELYQQAATDDLTGKNGTVNMLARQAVMAGSKVLRSIGGAISFKYNMN